jgi:uncharacterized protein
MTNHCNLSCEYYFTADNTISENNYFIYGLLKNIISDIYRIDELKQPNKIRIQFFGGEPLLKFDDIKFIIDNLSLKLKEEYPNIFKKIQFQMPTNLLLMDRDKFKYLFENNVEITFSFDGLWSNIQRNQKSHTDMLLKYLALKDDIIFYGDHYNLKTCKAMIYPLGLKEFSLVDNYNWIKNNFGIYPEFELIRDNKVWNHETVELFKKEIQKLYDFLFEKNSPEYPLPHIFKKWIRNNINFKLKNHSTEQCGIFKTKHLLTYDTGRYPCNIFISHDNFKNSQFRNKGMRFKEFIDTPNYFTLIGNNSTCLKCPIYNTCDKGCPIQIHLNNGTQEDFLCELFKSLDRISKLILNTCSNHPTHSFTNEVKKILCEEIY